MAPTAAKVRSEATSFLIIPARLASTRLPRKLLLRETGKSLIRHTYEAACRSRRAAGVCVAADSMLICDEVRSFGGQAELTDPAAPSGTDRVAEVARRMAGVDVIVNVQGDLPTVEPADIRASLGPLADDAVDIATLTAVIKRDEERTNPNVVKIVGSPISETRLRALYFTRSTLYGDGPVWRHVGVYGYRRAALERFCAAPPSPLEKREKLEQLRALEMGLQIWASVIDEAPLSVDNPADLEAARALA